MRGSFVQLGELSLWSVDLEVKYVCTFSFFGNCQIALQSGCIVYIPLAISVFFHFLLIRWVKLVTNSCFHLHPQDHEQGRLSGILPSVTCGGAGLGHREVLTGLSAARS